jgi:transposase-like protein
VTKQHFPSQQHASRNEKIRRRERVIRLFPNNESALRLIGALLAEKNETWLERTYRDMQEYHERCLRRIPRGQQRCCPLGLKPNRH